MTNHITPIEGRCFMGLNFSEEQFAAIQNIILDNMGDGEFPVEDAIAKIIIAFGHAGTAIKDFK